MSSDDDFASGWAQSTASGQPPIPPGPALAQLCPREARRGRQANVLARARYAKLRTQFRREVQRTLEDIEAILRSALPARTSRRCRTVTTNETHVWCGFIRQSQSNCDQAGQRW